MYPIAFTLATGELIFIDQLEAIKTHNWLNSPYIQARSLFWEDQVELFPAYSPHFPDFYWRYGPQLALPERAQSLQDWSHCIFCGIPLNNPAWDEIGSEVDHGI